MAHKKEIEELLIRTRSRRTSAEAQLQVTKREIESLGGRLKLEGKDYYSARKSLVGHNVLSPDGPECYCGKRGCVETLISGPALEAWYEAKAKRRLSLAQIAAATAHDHVARLTIDRLHLLFGQALANVVNILDPDVIVIGGGVGNVQSLYSAGRQTILPFLFNPRFRAPIIAPALGDSAGVFGAALLARGEFKEALLS